MRRKVDGLISDVLELLQWSEMKVIIVKQKASRQGEVGSMLVEQVKFCLVIESSSTKIMN